MEKTYSRICSLLLALCLALALPLGASAEQEVFQDVPLPQDTASVPWYAEAVYSLSRAGIINGAGTGRFFPEQPVTREEFITLLGRMAESAGKDLHYEWLELAGISGYARPYFSWAASNGIVKGDESGLAPQRAVTREEMAVILVRFCEHMGIDLPLAEPGRQLENQVVDQGQIAGWAREAMETAYQTGLINGSTRFGGFYDPETGLYACGYFTYLDPRKTVDRAQTAQIVYNYVTAAGIELPLRSGVF